MNLVADANVLLSAVIGGRARLALNHPQVSEIFTTEHTFAEVEEYTMVLARRKRLPSDILLLAVAALPVTVVSRTRYAKRLPEAVKRIGRRDPDDVDLLALALQFEIPIWSNDKDFEGLHVDLFTTERLLRQLGIIH
ncbi:MAG: PilT protein domain protein [Candidatus Sulfotelmatobacter sp.]|nr:PilT protein domain protein [Candidatus Sulfotelmatobacter sp.]